VRKPVVRGIRRFRNKPTGNSPLKLKKKYRLGAAWAGNSVNCVPFRTDAVRTVGNRRYVSYFDQEGDVVVAAIDLRNGAVQKSVVPNARKPRDAHQAISMGIDANGICHLAFGAHNSSLLLTRSRSDRLGDGFTELTQHHSLATYPMFLRVAGGELILLSRRGRHFDGEILVDRLSPALDWQSDSEPLLNGSGSPWPCGPYLNTPVVTPEGNVFLFVVWRLRPEATSAGAVVNVGIDALASRDNFRTLQTLSGIKLTLPVSPATSERIIAVPMGANLINQASAAMLPDGMPAVVTYWADADCVPQYRLCWPLGGTWQIAKASNFTTKFKLDGRGTLPLPHSRPEIVVRSDGRALVIYRTRETGNTLNAVELTPPSYSLAKARHQVLVAEDLGHYEPILDRSAWREKSEVVLYVQACKQSLDGDRMRANASSEASIVCFEWN
jgi:putative BNR repeat neuraminidase